MKTSYFAKYKKDDGISIAIKAPASFNGKYYPDLFPKWSFLNKYKQDKDAQAYIKAYHAQVLNKLDPAKVYDDLKNNTLLCWEKSGRFCHRRLVAKWLMNALNIDIPEV